MIASPAILASASFWVTLICQPQFEQQWDEVSPLVLNYLQSGERLRKLVIINPNGSREGGRWSVKRNDRAVELKRTGRTSYSTITFADPDQTDQPIELTRAVQLTGGHVLMRDESDFLCKAKLAAND